MNSNSFQNMAGGMQQPQTPMQRQPQLPEALFNHYSRQQAPSGWQTTVPIQERVHNALQIITGLRLIQGALRAQDMLHMATNFEMQTFVTSQSLDMYRAAINRKLHDIKDKRQSIANLPLQQPNSSMPLHRADPQQVPMQGAVPDHPQNQNQNQNQFPQGVPHHLPQQMQPSPVPMQQSHMQRPPGVENPAHPSTQQEQHWQRPQNMQQKPQSNFPALTQDELRQTSIMANEAMAKQTPESAEKLRANVPPMYKEQLAKKGIDPAYWVLQQQAVKRVQMLKYSRSQGQGSGQVPVEVSTSDASGTLQAVNTMPQRPTQPGGPMLHQPQFGGMPIDPHFHMSQYLAQQADASRLQDAGQLVVPASKNTFQHPGQPGQQQGIPRPANGTHGTPQQQPPQQQQQHSLANPQQLQAQAQARAAQMRANDEAKQAALRGQAGGLNGPQPGVQQSPAMSMLNRPMTQPGQQDTTTQGMTPNPAPYMNPQPGTSVDTRTGQMMGHSAQAPMRGSLPAQQPTMPPHVLKMLATLPNLTKQRLMQNPAELQAFMDSVRQQQAASGTSQAIVTGQPLQGGNGTPQMIQPGQSMNNQFMKTGLADMSQRHPQNQTQPTGFMPPQMPHRYNPQGMGNMPPAIQHALNSMTPDIIQTMDETPFPPGLLNPATSAIPANVRTWGDLKRWTQANAANMPPNATEMIRRQQALEYRKLFFQQHPQQQNLPSPQFQNGASGAGPQTMVHPTGPAPQARMTTGMHTQQPPAQQQLQPPQVRPPQVPQGVPAMQAPSIHEIQHIRQTNPGAANVTDDQIRHFLINQKLLQLKKQQNGLQTGQRQPNQQQQRPMDQVQQPNYNTQEDLFVQQQRQQRQLQSQEHGQAAMSIAHNGRSVQPAAMTGQRAAPGQNRMDGSIGQHAQNSLKRPVPGNDDVIEVPNPNLASNQNMKPPVQQTRVGQGHAGLTPEQLAAMTPKQRQRVQGIVQGSQHDSKQGQTENQNQAEQVTSTKQDLGGQGSPPKQILTLEQQRLARFSELLAEVGSKTTRKPPLSLNTEEKQEMGKKLALINGQLRSVDHAIRAYYLGNEGPRIESITRQVLQLRFLVNQQEKASSTESYSTTPSEFNQCLQNLWQFRQMAFKQHQEKLAQQQQTTPQQELAHLQTQQASAGSVVKTQHPGTPNLESQQQPAQHLPKAVNKLSDSKPPAAPTTAHPPFPLGASSPHGVPQYGPIDLTAEKLKLPPNKKLKTQGVSAASTPLPQQATPGSLASPLVGRQASPETKKHPVRGAKPMDAGTPSYKCSDMDCEASLKSFSRQEDLEKHTKEAHPPLEDPAQYALDNMAAWLGLNSDGSAKMEMIKPAGAAAQKDDKPSVAAAANKPMATAIQKSASKTGATLGSKQEVVTPQPGPPSTPMSRVATVNSALKAAPAAKDLLKTSQHPEIKGGTPGSPSPFKHVVPGKMKPYTPATPSKAEVKSKLKHPTQEELNEEAWANSKISADTIKQTFAGIDVAIGADIFDAYMDFSDCAEDLSPTDSTKSSEECRQSDISANDLLDLKVHVGGMDANLAAWFDPVMDVGNRVAVDLLGLGLDSPEGGGADKTKENGNEGEGETKKGLPNLESLKWDDVFGANAGLEDHSIPGWPERDVLSVFDDFVRERGFDALDDVMF